MVTGPEVDLSSSEGPDDVRQQRDSSSVAYDLVVTLQAFNLHREKRASTVRIMHKRELLVEHKMLWLWVGPSRNDSGCYIVGRRPSKRLYLHIDDGQCQPAI